MKNIEIFKKSLRKNSTDAEIRIWCYLKNRQFYRLKFRRQVSIEPYIVDFICFEKKVIIELDGGQHAENVEYDLARTKFLERKGYKVLRFWNNEVLENTYGVLTFIANELAVTPSPSLRETSPARGEVIL